jgi:protein-disulfide isomerase
LIKRQSKELITGGGLVLLLSVVLVASQTAHQAAKRINSPKQREVMRYVRERFGIPDTAKLTIAPFQNSEYRDFYQTTIYVENRERKASQPALITKDGRYMVIGNVFVDSETAQAAVTANAAARDQKIIAYVRDKFHVPDAIKLSAGPFQDSQYRDFYQATIYRVEEGGKRPTGIAFLTKDGRYAVIGNVYNLNADPRKEVERSISLKNVASVGPADAPVTIVEYADLECPMCARTHQFLAQEVIPKYGNRIRVVFKEFPLVQIHDWALTAAIANECAYEIDPSTFVRYRSMIFRNQDLINGANVRTLLLDFGERVGLDRLRLATCIDSKQSLPRIEADTREAHQLGIDSTPTLFINGRPVVGMPSPAQFYKILDQALSAAK